MERLAQIKKLSEKDKVWDIVVVGGGATGLGVAVDAATRGMSVALLEKTDFAKCTSSRSTKLVHGGVRYLQKGDVMLVLEALRERCDRTGALLVFDEIQTGLGRTGALFAMQRYGVTPDIVCLAKAFGGGMPLGAFVAAKRTMDALQTDPALGHITTFGGHPVCCAAGLAAFDYLTRNRVVEQVEAKGALYEELLAGHPQVREIRRSGLLLAVELGDSAKLYRMMELFKEAGILSDWFLYCDTAFRISPPLTISEEEVRDSARIVAECLDKL